MVLTHDLTITAKSSLLMVLDTVGASPTLTLTSMSNGQELDIVTLESYIHCGEQRGLPGASRLPRHAVGGGRAFPWSCHSSRVPNSLSAVIHHVT